MIRFFLTFLLLYGGMHVYAFFRLNRTFLPNKIATFVLAGWMLLQTSTPILVRLLERSELESVALWLAWPGYIWMGFLFIFCSILLAGDCLRMTVHFLADRLRRGTRFIPSPAAVCRFSLAFGLAAGSYALFEARQIHNDHVTVRTPKLPPGSSGIRVVQISDLHIGLLFHESRLESVLDTVRQARPDILVSTGDLIDGRLSHEELTERFDRMAAMIAAVPTPLGKYACLGNHEYYAGLEQAIRYTGSSGFSLLVNQSIKLPQGITISGIDDPARKRMHLSAQPHTEEELLRAAPDNRFHLVLKHRPVVPDTSDGLFDLQLSGHVHKGQIFPFYLLVLLEFPIRCGTSSTPGNSIIHVSRGSGTWGPPMRLLAPPEVTVIDILPESGTPQN